MKEQQAQKNSLTDYLAVGSVFRYFVRVFKKQDKKGSMNLRLMHGINRISIVMFGIAFMIWLAKRLFF